MTNGFIRKEKIHDTENNTFHGNELDLSRCVNKWRRWESIATASL